MKNILFLICSIVLFSAACQEKTAGPAANSVKADQSSLSGPPIVLSVSPVESPRSMFERFLPLKYYLERQTGRPVKILIAPNYDAAVEGLVNGTVHLSYLDPAAYCEARAKYRDKIIPLVRAVGSEGSARSVLVTRELRGIARVVDVKGKRLALGNARSSFSHLIPLAMLHDVGIDARDFSAVDYLQQEDRIALSVLIGTHDVGGISETVAMKYVPDGLRIIKRSDPVPQLFLCASAALSKDDLKAVEKSLLFLKDRSILASVERGLEGFVPAEDRDFDLVRIMIKNLTGKDYIEYGPRTIRFAVLPLYPATTIYHRYEPLMKYLSDKTGYEFKLVIPKDFDEFVGVVKSGTVDFSYQNPYVFAQIDLIYPIKALVTTMGQPDEESGGEEAYRGVIITRTDSPIKTVNDLINRRVMIVSPKSAGGFLSQKIFLARHGIKVENDMKIIDAKRQEKVILGVYNGLADAGFVREGALQVLKDEVDMRNIRVLATTNPLPNWPIASTKKVNPALANKVKRLLIGLDDSSVLKAAHIRKFGTANEQELEELKKY
ncbi:MAG TPA: phosphate/phosphite/phosphonate ABC transporter substrate-binding protein [Dissulfurispiraceae bacterium]|nr:phosphate/phosphite/phosphonate ABC transporter substrate-binding protein [Dissulfurispiraceae bacterium]